MRVCNCFELLGVPIGILVFRILEVLAVFDVVIKILQRMLESILEDTCIPVVRSAFISIDDMHEYSQFGFVGIVLDNFYNFSLGDVLILD
jgi:hypothetical protein